MPASIIWVEMNNSNHSKSHKSGKKKKKKDKTKLKESKKETYDNNTDPGKNDACHSIENIRKTEKSPSWLDAFKTASEVKPIIPLEEVNSAGDSSNILPISLRATSFIACSSRKRPLVDDDHSPQGINLSENSSESCIQVIKKKKKKKKKKKLDRPKCNTIELSYSDHDGKGMCCLHAWFSFIESAKCMMIRSRLLIVQKENLILFSNGQLSYLRSKIMLE